MTTAAEVWQSFIENPHQHQNIPNNAYAGYHGGKAPIPHVPVVADLADFGGIGDGLTDNTDAFKDAIEAAWLAGGGAVSIPAGVFRVEAMIHLNQSGIVLRGAGTDQTRLLFPNELNTAISPFIEGSGITRWFWQGGLLWIGPATQLRRDFRMNFLHEGVVMPADTGAWWPEQPSNSGFVGKRVANVTGLHEEGAFTVAVDDAAQLVEGQYFRMVYRNAGAAGDFDLYREMVGHPVMQEGFPWEGAGSLHDRTQWVWPVRIAKIVGNSVVLDQPLRLRTLPKWDVGFETMGEIISESGVENLTIELTSAPNLPDSHSHNVIHNAIYLTKTINCWVRNVDIVNAQNGILTRASKHIELRDFRLLGDVRLHHGVTIVRGHDNLITDFVFEPRISHGISIEDFASGNVFRRGSMGEGTADGGGSFDSHRYMSFDTIRSDIYVLNSIGRPGGNNDTGPLNGRRVVHWNIRGNTGTNAGDYVNMPDAHSHGALVGVQGTRSHAPAWAMVPGDKGNLIADEGVVPVYPDFYAKQLELRAATEPWIELQHPWNDVHAPGMIPLIAAANPAADTITSVRFYLDGNLLHSADSPPYSTEWHATGGLYRIHLEMDTTGGSFTSPARSIFVGEREVIENTDSRVVYAGSVTHFDDPTASGGSFTQMRADRAASATIKFRGTRFRIFVRNNHSTQQKINVYVNDLNNPAALISVVRLTEPRFMTYDSGPLPEGEYTVKIEPPSHQVTLDYLVVDTTGPHSGAGELPDIPAAPSGLTATSVTSTAVNLSWVDESDNEQGFRLERSLSGIDNWIQIQNLGTDVSSHSDAGLPSSTTFHYRLRAFNGDGNSPWSNTLTATTLEDPGIPALPIAPDSLVATAISESRVELVWTDNANNEEGFLVEQSTGNTGIWAPVASLAPNAQSFSSSGLEPATRYHYRVRAFNSLGDSMGSNVASATTLPAGAEPLYSLFDTFSDHDRTANPTWFIPGGSSGGILLTQADAILSIGRSSGGGHVYLASFWQGRPIDQVGQKLIFSFRARFTSTHGSNRNYEFNFGIGNDNATPATADSHSVYSDDAGYLAGIGWLDGDSALIRDAGGSNFLGRSLDSVDQQILGMSVKGMNLTGEFRNYSMEIERTESGLLITLSDGEVTMTREDTMPVTDLFNMVSIGYYNRNATDTLDLDRIMVQFIGHSSPPEVPDSFPSWIARFDDIDASEISLLDNPSGDGVPNLLKYAFGMNVRTSETDGLPVSWAEFSIGNTIQLYLQYRRRRGGEQDGHQYIVNDLVYAPAASTDMAQWFSIDDDGMPLFEAVGDPQPDPDDSNFEHVTLRLLPPIGSLQPMWFLRLEVDSAQP